MMAALRRMFGIRSNQKPVLDLSPSPERLEQREKTERLIEQYEQSNDAERERLIAQARSETRYYQALTAAMEILQ